MRGSRERVRRIRDNVYIERTEKLSGNPEPVHPPVQRHRVICVYLEQKRTGESGNRLLA